MTSSGVRRRDLEPAPALPIFDLHCDLLEFLERHPDAAPDDPRPRCSLAQLQAGGVALQVLALFSTTRAGSSRRGLGQAQAFRRLAADQVEAVVPVRHAREIPALLEPGSRIGLVAAIENASSFCEESEPLRRGIERFEWIVQQVGRPLYVSLTWNDVNRFGGGNATDLGLRADGRTLLVHLAGLGVAVDLSHASARLAREALDFIEAEDLELPVLASHSNFAALQPTPRNLPDDVARRIIEHQGLIGLNFMRPFLGDSPSSLLGHLLHAWQLGGASSTCFGADFFSTDALPKSVFDSGGPFFEELGDASCYPQALAILGQPLVGPEWRLRDLAYGNVLRFLQRLTPRPVVSTRETRSLASSP